MLLIRIGRNVDMSRKRNEEAPTGNPVEASIPCYKKTEARSQNKDLS